MRPPPNAPGRPGGYPRMTPGSMFESGPRRTSTHPVTSHLGGGALRAHRRLDGGQRADHAPPAGAARQRDPACVDGLDELQALVLQRLARLDFRAHDVAIPHEQLELTIRFRHSIARGDAPFEVPDPLEVVEVVEDDPPAAAHRDDFADLVRIGP